MTPPFSSNSCVLKANEAYEAKSVTAGLGTRDGDDTCSITAAKRFLFMKTLGQSVSLSLANEDPLKAYPTFPG